MTATNAPDEYQVWCPGMNEYAKADRREPRPRYVAQTKREAVRLCRLADRECATEHVHYVTRKAKS